MQSEYVNGACLECVVVPRRLRSSGTVYQGEIGSSDERPRLVWGPAPVTEALWEDMEAEQRPPRWSWVSHLPDRRALRPSLGSGRERAVDNHLQLSKLSFRPKGHLLWLGGAAWLPQGRGGKLGVGLPGVRAPDLYNSHLGPEGSCSFCFCSCSGSEESGRAS